MKPPPKRDTRLDRDHQRRRRNHVLPRVRAISQVHPPGSTIHPVAHVRSLDRMTIGLISDTHGYFDPAIPALFAGVQHILHAGDIGGQRIVDELNAIAPVTAVLGNNDYDPRYRDTEVLELNGCRILVHHIVERPRPRPALLERISRARVEVVVFGHTHERHLDREGGILWINPGYFGRPKPYASRSLALLHLKPAGPEVQFLPGAA